MSYVTYRVYLNSCSKVTCKGESIHVHGDDIETLYATPFRKNLPSLSGVCIYVCSGYTRTIYEHLTSCCSVSVPWICHIPWTYQPRPRLNRKQRKALKKSPARRRRTRTKVFLTNYVCPCSHCVTAAVRRVGRHILIKNNANKSQYTIWFFEGRNHI